VLLDANSDNGTEFDLLDAFDNGKSDDSGDPNNPMNELSTKPDGDKNHCYS
jgi:hypothetical protein